MTTQIYSTLAAPCVLAACAQAPQDDRADLLDRPIDCGTADIDLAALEAAIPGAGQRAVAGVRLVLPVARLTGRVTGQLDDRREIASGRSEEDLRGRIAEIQAACPGISAADPGTET